MIELRNVTKQYDLGQHLFIRPVQNISLKIEAGEFAMIIGRSGCGKSTLLNLVAGLVRPTLGQVLIDSIDVSNMSDKDISALRSEKIGFVFQFPSLLPSLTIVQNVAMSTVFSRNGQRHNAYDRAAELLAAVGLAGKKDVHPRQLSAGESKRAVIARSLINDPSILLADEPTSDLDEETEQEMMAMLQEINKKGVTILMVTHTMQLIPMATRVIKMETGGLVPVLR